MPIIKAYVMPHPPLAVPEVGRGKERGIAATLAAMEQVAGEVAEVKPDTIIFITPHGTMYGDYFHISPGEKARGDFARFGTDGVQVDAVYDTAMAEEISRLAGERDVPAGIQGEGDPSLDHGVTVPMYYINKKLRDYKTVRISQSGLDPAAHYRMGQILAAAAENLGRKVIVIASGDLSHKLADDGPYGYTPEGAVFDREVMAVLGAGDFPALMEMDSKLREKAAECGYGSFVMLAGCFDGVGVRAAQMSYEGPFGVGYGVVSFAPAEAAQGFVHTPLDPYRALAKQSLEYGLKTGCLMPLPQNLPPEMLSRRAGAFVSIHKNGQLRGCIGTIAPTTENIGSEIIQNAVSAGLQDTRFPPVDASELPFLAYKVDILEAPEEIDHAGDLDVKQYGVIVESGRKRGLLLPNLDGIDTVAQQIEIARQKAGISPSEAISLKRFKVVRYE
ncbi:MAG: AmmeMemoRadiSam system protein A [Defluviitaleaceae bacterium]|nr:AmmeMemoRadiSam system protein A [Defluviitaleaceae bacterium]